VRFRDILLGVLLAGIWGMGIVVAKAGFGEFPPIFLMALRFGLTALTLAWFVPVPRGQLRSIFLIAVVAATIQYSLTFTGLKGLDASTAVLILQMEVPFAVLLAVIFLKDRLGWRRAFAMALALVGVGLIAGEPRLTEDLLPVLLVLAGALAWGAGQVMTKALVRAGGFSLIAWVAVFATPQLFLSSYLFEAGQIDALRNAGLLGWGAVVYLGLVMTALGYALWYHLLGKHRVNQVMPFVLLVPAVTVAGGVLLLGEELTLRVAIGGLIVIAGVAALIIERRAPLPIGPQLPLSAADAEAVAHAYRRSRRSGVDKLEAMAAAAAVYRDRNPDVTDRDAHNLVSKLILDAESA